MVLSSTSRQFCISMSIFSLEIDLKNGKMYFKPPSGGKSGDIYTKRNYFILMESFGLSLNSIYLLGVSFFLPSPTSAWSRLPVEHSF